MTECFLCLELFNATTNVPLDLSCGHTYCSQCLATMHRSAAIECPQDRAATTVANIWDLPRNFSILRETACGLCQGDKHAATHICEECGCMCSSMAQMHKKVPALKAHKVTSIGEKESPVIPIPRCTEHNECFAYYDLECKTPVCTICLSFNHHGHKCQAIDEACKEMKSLIPKQMEQWINRNNEITQGKEHIDQILNTARSNIDKTRQEVKQRFAELHEILNKREAELMNMIDGILKTKDLALSSQYAELESQSVVLERAVEGLRSQMQDESEARVVVEHLELMKKKQVLERDVNMIPTETAAVQLKMDMERIVKMLWELCTVTTEQTNDSLNFDASDITSILKCMKAHIANEKIQQDACTAIKDLARNSDEKRILIAQHGGIEAVVAALKAHPGSELVQENGCWALLNLTLNDNNCVLIAQHGGIEAVIAALRAHPGSERVQQYGCWVLWNLAAKDNNKVLIEQHEGIETVVAALRAHPGSERVQQYGCGVLWNLAAKDNNKVLIVQHGGIETVVAALRAHPGSERVQQYGCGVLCYLAFNNDNRVLLERHGGIKAAIAALKAHPGNESVQEYACRALLNLANNDNNRVLIAQHGGIEAVIAALKAHLGSAGLQQYGFGVLCSLIANNVINKMFIVHLGGIEAVISALQAHSNSVGVQEVGCRALSILAYNDNNSMLIAQCGGIEAVIAALKAHSSSVKIQEFGCRVLSSIAYNDNNAVLIAQHGGIETVIAALRAHPGSEVVQDYGFGALFNIVWSSKDIQARAKQEGIFQVVNSAIATYKDNENIQKWGKEFLEKL